MFLTVGKLIMGRKFKNIIYFENKLAIVLEQDGLIVSFMYCFVTQHNISHLEALWRLRGKVRLDFRRLPGLVEG